MSSTERVDTETDIEYVCVLSRLAVAKLKK